jgi:hypothetical protein
LTLSRNQIVRDNRREELREKVEEGCLRVLDVLLGKQDKLERDKRGPAVDSTFAALRRPLSHKKVLAIMIMHIVFDVVYPSGAAKRRGILELADEGISTLMLLSTKNRVSAAGRTISGTGKARRSRKRSFSHSGENNAVLIDRKFQTLVIEGAALEGELLVETWKFTLKWVGESAQAGLVGPRWEERAPWDR